MQTANAPKLTALESAELSNHTRRTNRPLYDAACAKYRARLAAADEAMTDKFEYRGYLVGFTGSLWRVVRNGCWMAQVNTRADATGFIDNLLAD